MSSQNIDVEGVEQQDEDAINALLYADDDDDEDDEDDEDDDDDEEEMYDTLAVIRFVPDASGKIDNLVYNLSTSYSTLLGMIPQNAAALSPQAPNPMLYGLGSIEIFQSMSPWWSFR